MNLPNIIKKAFLITLFLSILIVSKVALAAETVNPAGGDRVSCPIANGKILTHSFQVDPKGGHCSPSYGYACHCGTEGRRAKAIDITGAAGTQAVLPQINGQNVSWALTSSYSVDKEEGGGLGKTFEAVVNGEKWTFDTLHLEATTNLTVGGVYPSGTPIGRYVVDHLHATVGKNLKQSASAGSATDCDPNWLPSDFMCDPNQQGPTNANVPINVIGDSLTKRAENFIKSALPNVVIDAEVGRQWDAGAKVLQNLVSAKQLSPVVGIVTGKQIGRAHV